MLGLPAILILLGLVLWLFTVYNTLGIILLVIGVILAVVGFPAGWYGGRQAP